jgi:hypothetical protein
MAKLITSSRRRPRRISARGVVGFVLTEGHIDGLMLVGAYREEDADASAPLASMALRWQLHADCGTCAR